MVHIRSSYSIPHEQWIHLIFRPGQPDGQVHLGHRLGSYTLRFSWSPFQLRKSLQMVTKYKFHEIENIGFCYSPWSNQNHIFWGVALRFHPRVYFPIWGPCDKFPATIRKGDIDSIDNIPKALSAWYFDSPVITYQSIISAGLTAEWQ